MKKEPIPISGVNHFGNELAEKLCIHFANMNTLSLRVKNFHWNVQGRRFLSLHQLFEEQYEYIDAEIDELAERIRALGVYVPASLQDFLNLSEIATDTRPSDGDGMLEDLITCYIVVKEHCGRTIEDARLVEDEVTMDMLIGHQKLIEKAIWLFRSSLSRSGEQKDSEGDKNVYRLIDSDILGLQEPDSAH